MDPTKPIGCLIVAIVAVVGVESQAASCVGLTDPDERLACYDALLKCGDKQNRRARLDCYDGVAVPGDEQPEPATVSIVAVTEDAHGIQYITLDNGQVWRELSPSRIRFEQGSEVELAPGWLGSVSLRLEGLDRQIRVRRVR